MTKISVESRAYEVSVAIPAYPQEPKPAWRIAGDLGIDEGQVRAAISWLKENKPELPLVTLYGGYRWSTHPDDIESKKGREKAYTLTRIERTLMSGLLTPALEEEDPELLAEVRSRVERIFAELRAI